MPHLVVLAVVGVAATGCTVRFKGVESFNSATTPVKYTSSLPAGTPGKWEGDPGGNGGIANGSGGLKAETPYGAGADPNSKEPINVGMDQPGKGIGQQAGEYHADPRPGFGQSNAPIAQPGPSDVNSLPARSGG
ncbi:hypothetical protein OP10G_4680 [Fimbriimonas ginsengisoli Gsoil 348]|uniref:Uncharacterized protein n=1 Tax=Fimbriimonas ginsengisoli Gsoil 348 TaxID=661478 RepID=A0A068NX37_FIMGI|nr:hypothetical protein OP10G_4680 [Fimbriimonas ginsengisoli Gsoil 348]